MEGRCESDCEGDEVYPAIFGDEERTGLKLDIMMMMKAEHNIVNLNCFIFISVCSLFSRDQKN